MSTDIDTDTDTQTLPPRTTTEAFRVEPRFGGPPGIANGGWLSGRLASRLPPGTTVEVSRRGPTPVGRELVLEVDHEAQHVRLLDGGTLLAEARPATASPLAPQPVGWAQAALAETGFRGRWDHPFPGCFVCGDRSPGDGLRIFPGPVVGRPGVVAARWTPSAADVTPDGAVPTEHVWAALGCPTAWVHRRAAGLALPSRLVAKLHRAARPCEDYIVVARSDAPTSGRAALYTRTGTLVATCQATWRDV